MQQMRPKRLFYAPYYRIGFINYDASIIIKKF